MIILGLGGNLPSRKFGPPQATLAAALAAMAARGIVPIRRSRWYRSAPVPVSRQPWYINGVAHVQTTLAPIDLLAALLAIEADFGRVREGRWKSRILDLDLIAYDDVTTWPPPAPALPPPDLPHPRMHERAFVLAPLAEIAPDWRHPVLGRTAAALLAALPPGQEVAALALPDDPAGPPGGVPGGVVAAGPDKR